MVSFEEDLEKKYETSIIEKNKGFYVICSKRIDTL